MATKKNKNTKIDEFISSENETVNINLRDTSNNSKLTDNTLIRVKSNVFGGLTYISKRSGEQFRWDKNGDILLIPLSELRAMKSNQPAFFQNQFIIILGVDKLDADCSAKPADIYRALQITQYYSQFFDMTDIDNILSWTSDEIKENVSKMSSTLKFNFKIALRNYIELGLLDKVSKIRVFEEALGENLREE